MLKRNCQNTCKNSIKTSIFLVCLISTLFVFFNQKVFAASNDTISFQGKIVRNDTGYEGLNVTAGNPSCVVSGASNDTCDFQAKYYDGPTGGATLLGTEDFANEEIGEFGGVFNLALGAGSWSAGSESTFTDIFNNNNAVYIELKFAPDGTTLTETFSRMQVRSSAYAIRAGTADRADIANEADDAFQFDSAADATGYTPAAGMVYYDSDESTLKLYNGASWEDITSGTGGSSLFTDAGDYTYLTNTGDSFVLGASSYTEIGTETYSTHLTGLDTETTPFAWDVDAQRLVLDGSGAKAGMTVYSNYDGADEWPLITLKTEHSGFTQPVLEISQDGTGPATSMYYGSSKIFEVGTQLEGAVRKAVVGIGVDTPDERLDVNGAIHIHDFTPSTTTNRLYSVAGTLYWDGSELGAGGGLWTDGGTFSYLTSTTDDVVIGTNTTTNAPFFFDVSEGAFVINGTGTGNLFTVNDELSDSSPFVVDSSGNVGIGTSSPTAKLDIAGTSSTISNNSGDITITADESVIVKADDTNSDNLFELMSSTGGLFAYMDSYGKLIFSAATASNAQIKLTTSTGVDPSSPVSGDLWWTGTSLYFNDGSTSVDLLNGKVSLAPSSAQVDSGNSTSSIFINKTGTGGNFLQFQASGADKFVVSNVGAVTAAGDIDTEGTLSLGSVGDQGSIRYNATDDVIEFSNDGSTWLPLGAATAKIILSPEYSGAVLTADGTANTGSMTSDSDANSKNYYEWNSSEVSLNDYDVRVRFALPSDFDSWSSTALTLNFVTEDTGTNSKADIYLYLASSGTVDDSAVDGASSSGGTWTSMSLQSADLNECDAANETCMLIIRMYSANDNYARVGDIELNYNRSL